MTNLSEANLNNGAAVGPQGEGMDSPSSFPAYPTYKDSGVEWLGVVPENWALGSLKHLAWIRNGRDYKEVESPDGEYPVIGSGGQFANATRYLYDGESVLLGRKGTIDKPLYIHGRFWTVDTMFYTEVTAGASAKFLYYNALTIPFQYYSTSTALPSMTQGDLLNHPCAIPALEEQTQIARFLDHETARIDALIEEQQRLIELLKEKRQAVISHAVTKGLDPTVPMKDSGVEWLGEVPAHWVVAGLKWYWSVTDCKHITAEFVDEGIPLASIREVQSRYVALDNAKQTTEVFYRQLIEGGRVLVAGDLIFSRNATVGEVAQVANWHPPFALGQDVCVLKKQYEWLSSDYLQAVLRSPVVMVQLDNLMIGSTFKRVNVEDIRGIIVPMPPQGEQKIIAEYLIEKTEMFNSMLEEAQNTIALLQERRSALISAAVTGKIDVRGWQPPASAPTPELVEEAV